MGGIQENERKANVARELSPLVHTVAHLEDDTLCMGHWSKWMSSLWLEAPALGSVGLNLGHTCNVFVGNLV